jgi:hypothetical protein
MLQLPPDFAQRILDAARIAAAMHREQAVETLSTPPITGQAAALVAANHDGAPSTDGYVA